MHNRHCRHIASTRRPKTYMRSVVRHTTLHARGHTTQGAVLRKSQPARAPRGTVANARPLAGHAQRTQPPHSKHTTVPHVHALCHAPHGSGTSVPSVRRVAGRGLQGHVRAGHKARVMRYQGRLHSSTKRTALPPAASTALHGIGDCTCLGRKCVRQLSRGVTRADACATAATCACRPHSVRPAAANRNRAAHTQLQHALRAYVPDVACAERV